MLSSIRVVVMAALTVAVIVATPTQDARAQPGIARQSFNWDKEPCDGKYLVPKDTGKFYIFLGCMAVTRETVVRTGDKCANPDNIVQLPANSRFAVWLEARFSDGVKCLVVTPDVNIPFAAGSRIILPLYYEKAGISLTYLPNDGRFLVALDIVAKRFVHRPIMTQLAEKSPSALEENPAANKPTLTGDSTESDPPKPRPTDDARNDAPSKSCVSPSTSTPAVADLALDQAQYVVEPRKDIIVDDILSFEQITDEFVESQVLANPFARSKVRYFPAKSLKYLDGFKTSDGKSLPRHFASIDVPREAGFEPTLSGLSYELRIVATQRGLAALKLQLVQGFFKRGPQVKLTIAWDEIDSNGKLKPMRSFNSFEALPSISTPPVTLTEQQFGNLINDITTHLAPPSARFDHLMIVKGDWAAPHTIISPLTAFAERKKEQGAFGYWMSFYSERTSANGNAYLKATLEKEGIGALIEARTEGEALIAEPKKLHFRIVEEAKSKAIREKKGAEKADEGLVTDVFGIGPTGHLISKQQINRLVAALGELSTEFKEHVAAEGKSTKLIQLRIEEAVPGFKVPKTAPAWLRRTISSVPKDEVEQAQQDIERATKALQEILAEKCDYRVFVTDHRLGWSPRPN